MTFHQAVRVVEMAIYHAWTLFDGCVEERLILDVLSMDTVWECLMDTVVGLMDPCKRV